MTTVRLTAGPPDAKTNPEGFRTYRWQGRELLSVTSIRKLVGEPYGLVNWQIGKVLDRALSVEYRQRIMVDRRMDEIQKVLDSYYDDSVLGALEAIKEIASRPVEELVISTDDLLRLRKWLRDATTEERDAAATKGIDIHGALELGLEPEQANETTRPYLRQVRHFLDDYGYRIVTQEFQIFNLTVGYAGTADVLFETPDGRYVLGDWKTSKSVYTEHVTQLHAYLAGEFVGLHDKIDEDLTAKLHAIDHSGILHLTANGWHWHAVPFSEISLRAFFGAVAFAQLLAAHGRPDALFDEAQSRKGAAPE